jgi:hypothetical protein
MELKFTVSESEGLAFSEQYYRDSASHQRVRSQTRWVLPIMLLPVIAVFWFQFGISYSAVAIFVAGIVAWAVIAPKRFDVRVRRYMHKQMLESSYHKSLGEYRLKFSDQLLICDSPTGYSEYRWNAVDRVTMTDEFLFIFLAGPTGFPIRIAEVGSAAAAEAYEKIQSLMANAR